MATFLVNEINATDRDVTGWRRTGLEFNKSFKNWKVKTSTKVNGGVYISFLNIQLQQENKTR